MTKHKTHRKVERPEPADEPLQEPEGGEAEGSVGPRPQVESGALVEPVGEQVERLKEELEQAKDRHLRLAAEFDNFRKRTQRERLETWSRAQADVVANVLDTLDDLRRIAALDADRTSPRDLLEGIALVERKLIRELGSAGLERVGVEGEPFDPHQHEAVSSQPAPSPDEDHRVAAVLQHGYRFGGALLRPARVTVAIWQEPAAGDGADPAS